MSHGDRLLGSLISTKECINTVFFYQESKNILPWCFFPFPNKSPWQYGIKHTHMLLTILHATTHFSKLTIRWLEEWCNRGPGQKPICDMACGPFLGFICALQPQKHSNIVAEKSSPCDFSSPASETLPLQPKDNSENKSTACLAASVKSC